MPLVMKTKTVSKLRKAPAALKEKQPSKTGSTKVDSVSNGVDMSYFTRYEVSMRERVDQGKIPGYVSTMLRNGKVLHSDAYGFADKPRGVKYGPDTIMRLFCMTKPFVAASIMQLHDQGKLSVDDSIGKYIPGFKSLRVVKTPNSILESKKAEHKMTILHCLTHTSGLGYPTGWAAKLENPEEKMYEDLNQRAERGEVKSLEEYIDILTTLPLRTEPGTKFCYSLSYDVLGRVIEVVSGKSLGQYLHDHIFAPLKMDDTGFSFPKSKVGRVAQLFSSPVTAANLGADKAKLPKDKQALCQVDGKNPLESRWLEGNVCQVESGGGFIGNNMGGLVSTMNDVVKFFTVISNGGGDIVKESTLNRYAWKDLLPEMCVNKQKGDHRGFSLPLGFSALGEMGLKKNARDAKKKSHMYDYDVGEVGCGGAACTYYSMDQRRKTVTLWCTQQLDNEAFTKGEQSLWHVNRKAIPLLPSFSSPDASSKKRKSADGTKKSQKDNTSNKKQRS